MKIDSSRLRRVVFPTLLASLLLPAHATDVLPPFVIAPMIEGFGHCPPLVPGADKRREPPCIGANELRKAIDQLEPNGAHGKVQVGYTLGINLLQLGSGKAAAHSLSAYSEALSRLPRPAVIYLMANHFAGESLKPGEVDDSIERFADQTAPSERYFASSITPLTVSLAPDLTINRKRLAALDAVGRWYRDLPSQSKQRIVAITLAGELHHYFDNFANGAGKFDDIRVTDYSPRSVREFQSWLRQKYQGIEKLNGLLSSNFTDFAQVQPPQQNIHKVKLKHIGEHFDSYAHGELPIEGWLETLPAGQNVAIYLNGRKIGQAEYGLNRQDVYEAVASANKAGVGFRYWLDFRELPRGIYTIQVVLEGRERLQLAQRKISIMGQSQAQISDLSENIRLKEAPSSIKAWLDRPGDGQSFFYNPLARNWLEFRSIQISNAYNTWFERAVSAGLPPEKLHSHQIAVATVGGWNPVLLASDASLQGKQRYRKGINLYAGSANIALLRRHYLLPGETFGVPEFHTMSWKDPNFPLAVIQELRAGGATFISPYFVSLVPAHLRSKNNAHNKFRLAPDNPDYGSHYLYSAIQKLAEE